MSDQPYHRYFPKPSCYQNQEKAMETIYKALGESKMVLFEGACGTGKTLSALAPALAVGKETGKKVIIATPVHQQMAQFIGEAREIRAKAGIKAVTFIGKEKMCPAGKNVHACRSAMLATDALLDAEKDTAKMRQLMKTDDWRSMSPDERHNLTRSMTMREDAIRRLRASSCDYLYKTLKEPNDRFRQWLYDSVRSPEDVIDQSEKEGKCGYELLKDYLREADLVICNYHHLIKPEFRERFLTVLGCKLSDVILIFDEAHNLEEQARASALAPIDEITIDLAEKEVIRLKADKETYNEAELRKGKEEARLLTTLKETIRQTYSDRLKFGQAERITSRGIDIRIRDPAGTDDFFCIAFREKLSAIGISLDEALLRVQMMGLAIYAQAEEDFKSGRTPSFDGSKLLDVATFLDHYVKLSSSDAHYPVISVRKTADARLYGALELCNCIAGELSEPLLDGPAGVVLMSATLQPFDTLKEVLRIKRDTVEIAFGSPFPPERRKTIVVNAGPLMFANRGDQNLEKTLVQLFQDVIEASAGNVLFFFQTAEEARKYSQLIKTDVPVLVPEKGTSPEKLKNQFFGYGDSGSKAVLMAYLWGTLTEGVDYKYDRCRTVVIVGVGLQNYRDDRSQAIINAYESLYPGKGMEYVVSQPAVKKIRQACGRVIRSPTDYGVTILVDSRYTKQYSDRFGKMGYFYKFPEEERKEFVELKPEDVKPAMVEFFKNIGPIELPAFQPASGMAMSDGGKRTKMEKKPPKATLKPQTVKPLTAQAQEDTDPLSGMLARLKSPNSSMRWKAAMDLGTTGNPKAVEPLIRALDDSDTKVIMNAIWSLARLGDVRALDPLQLLFRHKDKNVRDEARKAVKKIYGKK
ncbi:helicase C-terminal domain-containing protein [Methanocella arvoryzae]|uniref:ATP-dependent helicase n=1 Tax=Methanocella arvoryzae (strain DSM 22066 / NBRC 105507 / MRE50) TaxID=351160 RepID=Q0W2A9_METAR|nr:helicase C-terminal domain-containing protein [Methanocella arvoryzae]CAJ37484.1 putative ATP-dependent helicase [Methanocella arvoryzae MRE50]